MTDDQKAQRKLKVLHKKLDASLSETQMFSEELDEIKEKLEINRDQTLKDIEDKLELLIEMLRNRLESLEQNVSQHYKKQNVLMKEATNNLSNRRIGLEKLSKKVQDMINSGAFSNSLKLERLEEEFIELNRSYNSSFHQFKH